MPYSSGTFSLVSGNPVTTGTTISSTWANNTLNDIASGLSSCLLKDGTQTVTANIPMSSFKFTGLAAGSAAGDSLRYQQLFTTGEVALLGSVSASGSLALGTTLYVGASASVSGLLFVGGLVSASGAVNFVQSATLTATSTVALGASTGNYAVVTGTATVSSFDSLRAGGMRVVQWSGATPISNSANMVLPGGADLTTAANDLTLFVSDGAGVWRALHQKASGAPNSMSPSTNSLVADVSCSATGTFFTGPTLVLGTGTWFVNGGVTVEDTGASAEIQAKLWDGTSVIDSGQSSIGAAGQHTLMALSGYIVNPAGNVRISVRDISNTTGIIRANQSGQSKDSTLTAIRIA